MRVNEPFFGDFDEMRERRIIRVLVSYNRTNFFIANEGKMGIEYELLKSYEQFLNRGPLKTRFQTHIVFIVVPFNQLFESLLQGYGDIAASGLTITEARQAQVDFTSPYLSNISEVLVGNKFSQPIERLEDLSGKQVILVDNSSYYFNLQMLNQVLGQQGLAPIQIIKADAMLDAEDLLELVNAEIYDYTVVDNHLAELWQLLFENLVIFDQMTFAEQGQIGWAVRKDNPKLKQSLNQFISNNARPGSYYSNVLLNKYFKNTAWANQPLTQDLLHQLDYLKPYFQVYADFYDFDWILVAALAYQESRFVQKSQSHQGAVGIMQIKPSTANSDAVGIAEIDDPEQNIHAGVRYLSHLKERYFSSPNYTEAESLNFTLAAYNAGPTRIRQLQRIAEREGLNPYKWFYNVEQIARNKIGLETVNYVISIQKHAVVIEAAEKVEMEKRLNRGDFP